MLTDAGELMILRRDALAKLLQWQHDVERGPHHLYLDQIRTALEDNIDMLTYRSGRLTPRRQA